MHLLIAVLFALIVPENADSLRTTDIEEVVVVSTPKENLRLRRQPLSSSSFSQASMSERGIVGIKDFSAEVPNLFIPSYGSHLTTSVYVRGIGSRIGTPAVALYIDGVPQVSAASYDFNFAAVDRVDVLRGPQSTLYGRNSMGGVIRVFTKNPMQYQGTDITFDASHAAGKVPSGRSDGGGIGRYRLNLTHYHRINERFAFSGHLFGDIDGGYFRNEGRDDEYIDDQKDFGARMRFIIKPKDELNLDLTVGHEWLRQGGYPYEYRGVVGTPSTPEPQTPVGHIAYDNRSGYRRNLTNVGLTTERLWPSLVLTSVTGFQHLHDRMDLDQDFTTTNLYTLMQRQNANTLSEEVVLKNRQGVDTHASANCYDWLFGLNVLQQWMTTDGPVAFHTDGLGWLNGLINRQGNAHLPTITSHDKEGHEQYTMNFVFDNQILGPELAFPSTFKTPATNLALYHQSTLDNLFGVEHLGLTAGLRLDYERFALDHDACYAFDQRYGLNGRLTYPDGSIREGMTLVPQRTFRVDDGLQGRLHKDYLQLLPRVTLQYAFRCDDFSSRSNVYATLSRGYRSGGYNVQMFSDLLQARMQTSIMHNVASAMIPVVQSVTMIPSDVKQKVSDLLEEMGKQTDTDVQAATWYKPENSWNYELGTHLNLFNSRLQADLAAFLMDTRDQQVSKMSAGGLGRVTVNSGRSRSLGAEVSLRASLTDNLSAYANYGFTHAKFRDDDRDTFVPFVPRHTFSVGATQHWSVRGHWLDGIALHVDYSGAGRIYWTEANTVWQDFVGTLNGRLAFHKKGTELSLYAHNILSTRFETFYFETMQRGFAQYSRPMEVGLQLRLRY